MALIPAPWVLHSRGELARVWAGSRRSAVGVGLLSPLAYVLVLYALARAVLAEGDGRRRMIAAGAIVLGVTALALG